MLSCFNGQNEVALSNVKSAALNLCEKLELRQLSKMVGKGRGFSLSAFCSVKTHAPLV